MPIPFFKAPRVNAKVRRGLQRQKRTSQLDAKKDIVRRRDKWCRVPLCGCRKFRLQLHVSHSTHQGMGGDPKGCRSDPETMVLVCAARHREHAISLDRHTLRWEPVTPNGSNGPIRWLVEAKAVAEAPEAFHNDEWVELARETAIGQWEPFTDVQRRLLDLMSTMTV